MQTIEFKKSFLDSIEPLTGTHLLFESVPNTYFWIKNTNGQFILGNQLLVEKYGCLNESDLVGKTDYDFFPEKLCHQYREDDIQITKSKKGVFNRVELVFNENRTMNWHSTNKIPLFDRKGEVVGIAGITHRIDKTDSSVKTYQEMSDAIDYISKKYSGTIEIKELAYIAGLSVSQFERKFKQYFHESPMKFVIRVRINAACKELITTNNSISKIAYTTGFYDQSYFSKKFTSYMGVTPKEYRKKYFKGTE